MKHGKNPTKAQKRIIAYYKLDLRTGWISEATDKQLCLYIDILIRYAG